MTGYVDTSQGLDSLVYKQLLFIGQNAKGLPEGLMFTRDNKQTHQQKIEFAANCKFATTVENAPTYSIPANDGVNVMCLYKRTSKSYWDVLHAAGIVAAATPASRALPRWDIIAREYDGFDGMVGTEPVACIWNMGAITSMCKDDKHARDETIADIFNGGCDVDIFGGTDDIVLRPRGANKVHYKVDHGAQLGHDLTIDALIPHEQTECAIIVGNAPVCSASAVVAKIATAVATPATEPLAVMTDAKKATGCETERCVLENLESSLGSETVKKTITERLKVDGPRGIALLSNDHIDKTLQQWRVKWPRFYAYNFNMRNYAMQSFRNGRIVDRPDSLATVDWTDINPKYNCAGCVINADLYSGGGTHWMALFLDARGPQRSVEFFNSSGNSPGPEWVSWLCKMKNQMEDGAPAPEVSIVKVARFRHQHSTTECGVYALFYIWSRLNGVPAQYWLDNPVPDQVMFEFRQHLFHDKKFDHIGTITAGDFWATFQKMVPKIGWEPDS